MCYKNFFHLERTDKKEQGPLFSYDQESGHLRFESGWFLWLNEDNDSVTATEKLSDGVPRTLEWDFIAV